MRHERQQMSLKLVDESPAQLTTEAERDLIEALAELILACARATNDAAQGDPHDEDL